MNELRVTDTNSANDSKGKALGLEGNDFVYIVGAIIGALAVYLLLHTLLDISMGVAALFATAVLIAPLAWVLLLRRNKPDGYADDFFDQLLNGEGWSFAPQAQPKRLKTNSDEQGRS